MAAPLYYDPLCFRCRCGVIANRKNVIPPTVNGPDGRPATTILCVLGVAPVPLKTIAPGYVHCDVLAQQRNTPVFFAAVIDLRINKTNPPKFRVTFGRSERFYT
ncbi:MAG: hypothetical protein KatS3mg054_1029 [Chloroflexus sp.]|jgi:hypothetical protein|nr:MAG: hypothetical protein KatS3mg054_1029 [Chloroflexus sp.]GIV94979.1 MAG: hypothetical protein KatS3mg056_3688 [Chloroflexus sp.]